MKITYVTALSLLFLAACLPAAAQADVNPDHFSDIRSAQISASSRDARIETLQTQLEDDERQLQAKAELVKNAWQEAVSVVGDFSGPYIAEYLQQQKELDQLQTALTPKMEQTRAMIAALKMLAMPSDSTASAEVRPAHPTGKVVAANNSQIR